MDLSDKVRNSIAASLVIAVGACATKPTTEKATADSTAKAEFDDLSQRKKEFEALLGLAPTENERDRLLAKGIRVGLTDKPEHILSHINGPYFHSWDDPEDLVKLLKSEEARKQAYSAMSRLEEKNANRYVADLKKGEISFSQILPHYQKAINYAHRAGEKDKVKELYQRLFDVAAPRTESMEYQNLLDLGLISTSVRDKKGKELFFGEAAQRQVGTETFEEAAQLYEKLGDTANAQKYRALATYKRRVQDLFSRLPRDNTGKK